MEHEQAPVCCSAPGKVLLTGGYLILQRDYSGLVLTTSARFYSTVRARNVQGARVAVLSPQFQTHLTFEVTVEPSIVVALKAGSANPFIENALLLSLHAARLVVGTRHLATVCARGVEIVIQGDNSFYSQDAQLAERSLPATVDSLRRLPRFVPLLGAGGPLRKTGLGSSAALTTSLTAALLVYFGAVKPSELVVTVTAAAAAGAPPSPSAHAADTFCSGRAMVHAVAQAAHCAAQGKLGSGFDVSSAVFGSQQYRRFSPSVLEPLLAALLSSAPSGSPVPPQQRAATVDAEVARVLTTSQAGGWDSDVQPLSLPPGCRLLLGDVGRGSNTPNMVAKVLAWRDARSEASIRVISQLSHFNQMVVDGIVALKAFSPLADGPHVEQRLSLIDAVRTAFVEVRRLLREMGTLAAVDIEPPSQQELCDATMALPGVLLCGVPGAGGYDAVASIAIDDAAAVRIQALWESRSVLLLDLTEDHEGVRLDPAQD